MFVLLSLAVLVRSSLFGLGCGPFRISGDCIMSKDTAGCKAAGLSTSTVGLASHEWVLAAQYCDRSYVLDLTNRFISCVLQRIIRKVTSSY